MDSRSRREKLRAMAEGGTEHERLIAARKLAELNAKEAAEAMESLGKVAHSARNATSAMEAGLRSAFGETAGAWFTFTGARGETIAFHVAGTEVRRDA